MAAVAPGHPPDFVSDLPADMRDNAALATSWLGEDVGAQLDGLVATGQNITARFLFHALSVAGVAGYRTKRSLHASTVLLERDGQELQLGVLAFNTHGATRGRKEDIARLVSALTSSFGDQRFLLYLRRPLPEDVDPAPVARAVHLWLLAIERGEWLGRHAVYDDDGVSIELSLLPGAPGMAAMVGPTNALEQLALVDHHVLEAMELMDNNVPTVLSVCSATGWNLPRGFTEQLLYGTADQVVSGDEYRATFRETAMALFSDAGATDLASLWWLETPGDDMSVRGWATDNPWVRHDIPVFPGHRFSVARRVADRAELTWHSSEPTVWGRR